MKESAKIVIVGGGAVGLSVAYHLARRGETDVLLLERHSLTSGTTWHAAGIVGPLRATLNMTRLAMYAGALFPRLEEETGQSTGYRQTGGFWLASRPERMDELHRIRAMGEVVGLSAEIVPPESVAEAVPGLRCDDLVGALRVAEDGQVNPVDLCMAYAKAARAAGVTIREGVAVEAILTDGGVVSGLRLTDGTTIACDQVALCAGAWSRALAETADVALPLQAVEHMYVVTQPVAGLPEPFPILRDLDAGIYLKVDAGKLVLGGFEPDAKLWRGEGDAPFLELPEDWDQFAPFMEAGLHRCPALETAGIAHFMNGPESFTADTKPLVGETPDVSGLFVAAGMNSVGVMSSAGIGRALADWMLDGHPGLDLWEVDVARADPLAASPDHLAERMHEAVADQFAMHWPYKQPKHGRGLRKSLLHDRYAKAGAVFGVTAGWERPLWYARNEAERTLPYATGAQPWWPIAEREAKAMTEGVALIDLAPLSKFRVAGPDALVFLQRLCTADISRDNETVYTQMLNERGGIECDVTIDCQWSKGIEGIHFFDISDGASTRFKTLAWLSRHAIDFDLNIYDVSDEVQTIGVMGPRSCELLDTIFKQDLDSYEWSARSGFTEYAIASLVLADKREALYPARRVSFVGELGWEIDIEDWNAEWLSDALSRSTASFLGHHALDGCRMEKGYVHWGHDVGPDITPLEAGLGFTIDWSKDFFGKETLLKQREEGIRKRRLLFSVEGEPLLLHDEPIREIGKIVGLTTSGARGPRTGLNLCMGFVTVEPGETHADTLGRRFGIDVAGRCYPATALAQPPYDPTGKRMRG